MVLVLAKGIVYLDSHLAQLELLKEFGFRVSSETKKEVGIEGCLDYYHYMLAKRDQLTF